MPAAILIPLAIQAGASVGSALIQKHATGKAVDAQQKAGERARQDLAPYATAGARAATTLSDLTFGGPAQLPRTLTPGPTQPPPGSMASMRPQGSPLARQAAMGYQPPGGAPPPGSMAAMAPQRLNASGYGLSAPQQAGPMGGGIQMQAPDGRMVLVPQERVAEAEANGGRRVG